MHPNPRRIIPVVILLVAAAAAGWYLLRVLRTQGGAAAVPGWLGGSGTIEATQIDLGAELSGKVLEVLASEGDTVSAGQVVLRFDNQLLAAQLVQAQAALQAAQANYELVAAGTPSELVQVQVAAAELEIEAAQQALDELSEKAPLAAAQAAQDIASTDKALDRNADLYSAMTGTADQADIDAARAAVVLAKDKLDKAKEDFAPYQKKPEDNVIRAALQAKLAEAQKRYDAAVERLNNLLGKANPIELAVVEADEAFLRAFMDDAHRRYDEYEDGPDPEAVALATQRLALAKAQLTAARLQPTPEQLAVAQAQIETARSAIGVLEAQMKKLEVLSPLAAIVLERSVEPGEVAVAGAPLLVLARLDSLTITIYLPEDQYGQVVLGQEAWVTVDSFPGETFSARVSYIADQAEFTPRNVQTAEGRRTTVFAVRLSIANGDSRLKPGMPADVVFQRPAGK